MDSTAQLGVWGAGYSLIVQDSTLVTDDWARSFAVRKKLALDYETPKITLSVQSDKEEYLAGETGIFTVIIRNLSDEDRKEICYFRWHRTNAVTNIGGVEIPAKGEKRIEVNMGPLQMTDTLDVHVEKAFAYRGIIVYAPKLDIGLELYKEIYQPGEEVNVSINISNPLPIPQTSNKIEIKLKNELNAEYWENNYIIDKIEGSEIRRIEQQFYLDSTWLKGKYYIEANVFNEKGDRIGYGQSKVLEYYGTYLEITPIFPSIWKETNIVKFKIENKGKVKCGEGKIELSLYNQNNAVKITDDFIRFDALEIGENKIIDKEINIDWHCSKAIFYVCLNHFRAAIIEIFLYLI
ncbi:MAG: hypothetical protein HY934_05665, partial [Candidatus Firestonebacteria bacterium]|nr:hypothetical protein [Candidatus Firestonebacteria bacterium]